MVVVTITKIGSGGPGWRTFAETVLAIVRQREDGIGINSKDRKWEQAGAELCQAQVKLVVIVYIKE